MKNKFFSKTNIFFLFDESLFTKSKKIKRYSFPFLFSQQNKKKGESR
jgi:hypothetical protein